MEITHQRILSAAPVGGRWPLTTQQTQVLLDELPKPGPACDVPTIKYFDEKVRGLLQEVIDDPTVLVKLPSPVPPRGYPPKTFSDEPPTSVAVRKQAVYLATEEALVAQV